MKVVNIIPGSGGAFYCENCLRDSALVRAMIAKGHDVMMAPMYLPVYTDDPTLTKHIPVFFGGINVYLKEKVPLFRRMPRWVDRVLDSRWMLRMAARKAGSTKAAGLGPMTLAMIRGDSAYHEQETDRMLDFLLAHEQPDVVHIATIMLIGLAHRIRARTKAPIVVSFQDEDYWLDALEAPYNTESWEAIGERLGQVDRFVTVSRWYRDVVSRRLPVPNDKFDVVLIGIDPRGYEPIPSLPDPPVLGYLSKMTPSLGLGVLVDALILLRKRPGFGNVRLMAMGGMTGTDAAFLTSLRNRLWAEGMEGAADFIEEFDRESRLEFLHSISVMCVPMPRGEAFGTFMLEAMASGVPVLQPNAGAFPEIIDETGGGWLFEPGDTHALVDALERVLSKPDELKAAGMRGRTAVMERFTVDRMADGMVDVYRKAKGP